MPDSDYSDFGAEGDQDSDQLEMQVIYDQQQRNRNTGQVSEIELMQVKAEIEDTEDTGNQEMHQTSLETEDSFIPLSTGDTKGQSTLPSSEDVEVTTQDQEETLVMEEVKVSEKLKVARQPTELYQPPAQRQQNQSNSQPSGVSMKPRQRTDKFSCYETSTRIQAEIFTECTRGQ